MGVAGDRYECPGPNDHAVEVRITWCAGCSRWHFRLLSVWSSGPASERSWNTEVTTGTVECDDLANNRWRKLIDRAAEEAFTLGHAMWQEGEPRLW